MSKGPMGPRRSPGQAIAAAKRQDAMQSVRDAEMDRRLQEAYKKAQGQSTTGMMGGGMVEDTGRMMGGGMTKYAKGGMTGRDGCAMRGKTKGRMV